MKEKIPNSLIQERKKRNSIKIPQKEDKIPELRSEISRSGRKKPILHKPILQF